jgi:hypothetical protein
VNRQASGPVQTLARHRTTLLIAGVALVAVVLTAWLGRGRQTYAADLDPANPDGAGAQALARALGQQGVDLSIVRSADALDRTTADGSTTIVVTSTGNLGRSTTDRLLSHQGRASLVVVAPGPALVRQLGLATYPVTEDLPDPVPAGCPAYDGLSLHVPAGAEYTSSEGCFQGRRGVLLAEPHAGLTLVGAPALLTNDQILDGDNAAVALRLLGQRQRLVWYVPDLADLGGADSVSASSLLPDWLRPAIWLLALTTVAVMVWRGRRLGPLAREPLPVEVKAIETTRSLGRLYRRAGDRAHAAEALRAAARSRLTERLRLPRSGDPAGLVDTVAARSGRRAADVAALLDPHAPAPASDRDLTVLAHQLTELDREVSHP